VSRKLSRRTFLEQLSGVTAASVAAGVMGSTLRAPRSADASEMGPGDAHDRRWQAYKLRHDTAMAHSHQSFPAFPTNGDEDAYPTKIASYTR
jgi:hypothetical protein